MMSRFIAIVLLGLGSSTAAFADPVESGAFFSGSYTAATTTSGVGTPVINAGNSNGSYLPYSFSGTLTQGQTTAAQNFLSVSPSNGAGLVTGSIAVDFSFLNGSGSIVTAVSGTVGANPVSLSGGVVAVDANYAINYRTQTDCITWAGSCTPAAQTGAIKTALSNTILVSFADGAALDVNLYDWSDWTMEPEISFEMVSGPTAVVCPVPEPSTIALFATALAGLALMKRRRLDA